MKKTLLGYALILLLSPGLAVAQITVPAGGTGTTTIPRNYVVIGSSALRATAVATSSLGLPTFSGANTWTGLNAFNSMTWVNATGTNVTATGLGLFGDVGGIYNNTVGSGFGTIGFNSNGYLAGVAGFGALMQLAPSTGVFTMFLESNVAAGAAHAHTTTLQWDGTGIVYIPQGFVANASSTIGTLHLGTVLEVRSGGTASSTLGGILTGNGTGAVTSATVSSPLTFSGNTLACATCGTGSVTSIVGGTGLKGGTITNTGTLSLSSYLGTSTADTANQISVFTSTNATPATFGGFANFTFDSTANKFTVINASTTNLTASQSLFVASKQVNPYQNGTFAYGATSTAWTGTTTGETYLIAPFDGTLKDATCLTSAGTLNVQAKINSTNVVPMFNGSTTAGTVTFTGSNTFVRGDKIDFTYGTPASSPTAMSCTARTTVSSF